MELRYAIERVTDCSKLATRLVGNLDRIQPLVAMPVQGERGIGYSEHRPANGRVHAEFVARPFDRQQRVADNAHLLAPMQRFRSDQQVRDVTAFEGAHVIGGRVRLETAEQNADVPRVDGNAPAFFEYLPAAPVAEPLDEACRH